MISCTENTILYRMEAVEHIGSGIKRIRNLCREYGVDEPDIEVAEHWFTVRFPRPELQKDTKYPDGSGDETTIMQPRAESRLGPRQAQVEAQEAQAGAQEVERLQEWEISLLRLCVHQNATGTELLKTAGYSSRTGNFKRGLEKLLNLGLLEMTIPDKPRSSKQQYQLTSLGRQILTQQDQERT